MPVGFNWYSLPTFAAMLLFWLLAAYVLTRSPGSRVSLMAVAAQASAAAYLLGQGMLANASAVAEWVPWVRNLQWGATVAPTLWYWVTVLLLREQDVPLAQKYLRWVGYPLGVLLGFASVFLAISEFANEGLYRWSEIFPLPEDRAAYSRFALPPGPLYPGFALLILGATCMAVANVALGWRLPLSEDRHDRFGWLLVSAAFFFVGANGLGVVNLLSGWLVPTWMGHLVLAAAMLVMAWNVAAYSLLVRGRVIRVDFFYFVTALVLICAAYAVVILAAGGEYSYRMLGLGVVILTVVIVSHALVDMLRRALDRVFFASDVQHLRSNLTSVVVHAALTEDLGALLAEAQRGIADVSTEHFVHLTEQALRRLNNPSALAECGLLASIPRTLVPALDGQGSPDQAVLTPLERARALRQVLIAAIERLKPSDADQGIGSPAALQYNILREEYLLGMLNKQIMARHSISEGTFHRNRRQAIWSLARELKDEEEQLTGEVVLEGYPGGS